MTRDEANARAKRIVNVWRTSIPHAEWANYLIGFDAHIVDATIDRERASNEFAPSLKTFGDLCRATARRVKAEPSNVVELPARRLSRDERIAILTRNGAPLAIVDPAAWAQKGPL